MKSRDMNISKASTFQRSLSELKNFMSLYITENKNCVTAARNLWKRYSIYQRMKSTNFHSITTFIHWVDNFFNCLMIVSTTTNKITFHIPPIFTILIKKYGSNLWTITVRGMQKIYGSFNNIYLCINHKRNGITYKILWCHKCMISSIIWFQGSRVFSNVYLCRCCLPLQLIECQRNKWTIKQYVFTILR